MPGGYIAEWLSGALEFICREVPIGIADSHSSRNYLGFRDAGDFSDHLRIERRILFYARAQAEVYCH
jgi:hypothetical protein